MFLLFACVSEPAPPPAPSVPAAPVGSAAEVRPAAPAWPAAGAPLTVLASQSIKGTLLLDAGHGAPGNPGNTNWRCESEGDVMRRVTDGVYAALAASGTGVRRTRPDEGLVPYDARLRASATADWFVSLHSDTRGGEGLHVDPSTRCYVTANAAGFSVLWSDEGVPALVERRHRFARSIATRMAEAGFLPYGGVDYAGLYEGESTPGVFVDRHTPKKRIMLLRRPRVPSVIVETHQAWDPAEAARWEEPATWAAFAAALQAAVADQG